MGYTGELSRITDPNQAHLPATMVFECQKSDTANLSQYARYFRAENDGEVKVDGFESGTETFTVEAGSVIKTAYDSL